MKTLIKTVLVIALFALPLFAQDYVVIVNPANSITEVDGSMLKRLYSGRAKELNGAAVVPVNQVYTNPITSNFLSSIVGKSTEEYKEYWVAQQIKGLGSAPMIQPNDAAVINIVAAIPGAIGYIAAGSATGAVKVIPVK